MYGKVYPREGETVQEAIQRLNKIATINGLPLGKPLYCKRNHINVAYYEKPSEKKRRRKAIARTVIRRAALRRRLREADDPPE
jgi:hypothetical protein